MEATAAASMEATAAASIGATASASMEATADASMMDFTGQRAHGYSGMIGLAFSEVNLH